MKITLEFFNASEKTPESNKNIFVVYKDPQNATLGGGQSMSIKQIQDWGWEDATKLWWAYFDFQPERSKREDSQQCEMRCSEHCGNTVSPK